MKKMANLKPSVAAIAALSLACAIFLPTVRGHEELPQAPALANDGTTIDQGIAYVLMLLALVLTYLIHTFDVPFYLGKQL